MLVGTLDPGRLEAHAPPLTSTPPAAELDDVDLVQAVWELAGVERTALMPPALHPTSPMMLTLTAAVGVDSGVGLLRLSCRHGARARALLIGAVAWGAGEATAESFGCNARRARVGIDDGWLVVEGDDVALRARLDGRRDLGADDVQYVTGLHPVVLPDRGIRLLQVELLVESGPARAHRPLVETFTWPGLATSLRPVHPIAATIAPGSLRLPQPRFVARTDVLAHLGSEKL